MPCSINVPYLLRNLANVTLSTRGHPMDVSPRNLWSAVARSHCQRWTWDEFKEVMWCFYYAKAKNRGLEIEVFKVWRERNPDMRPTLDSKKLASQRRYVLSSGKFTAEQLADIQRNAELENNDPVEGSSFQ